MEAFSTLFAVFVVAAVLAFMIYYPSWAQKNRGCNIVKPLPMILLGSTELFALLAADENLIFFIAIILLIIVVITTFLFNKRDSKSWWHGILITLWQSLVFIAVLALLIDLMNFIKRLGNHND